MHPRYGRLLLCRHHCVTPRPGNENTLLRWFEAYAEALHSGMFRVGRIMEPFPWRGVGLYPQTPPLMRTATTNGVVVRVSTLIAPELSEGTHELVSYEVRFSMLPEDELPAHIRHMGSSVQLRSRRWRILNHLLHVVDTVEGEGVVGRFPVLTPNTAEVVYRSCTHCHRRGGWMEGEFEFVPGTLDAPRGEPFFAECPRFSLAQQPVLF